MEQLVAKLTAHFNTLTKKYPTAFDVFAFTDPEKSAQAREDFYQLYQDSFRPEDNKIYRERREYDCSACRNFIRNMGGVIFIDNDFNKISIWDIDAAGTDFEPVLPILSKTVKALPIQSIYVNDGRRVGIDSNLELLENGQTHKWSHVYLDLPNSLMKSRTQTIAEMRSQANSSHDVFKRGLTELTTESLQTVLDLIAQNSLYKGAEWKQIIQKFLKEKTQFDKLSSKKKELFVWSSPALNTAVGRLRNTSMGTLLVDLSEGRDLNEAVSAYERIVAPTNYKRPKALFTPKMVKAAQEKIEELGLTSALQRRFAVPEDISVSDIAFVDRDVKGRMRNVDVFENLMIEAKASPKKFDRAQEIGIEEFMRDVLPTLTRLEAFVEGRHARNFVSLIAPVDAEAKNLFQWDNNFSWAYAGNITDSDIRENVKSAGGNVDGFLRFSLQWNSGDRYESDDLDAHCRIRPNQTSPKHIYFGNKSAAGGQLDVDIMHPKRNVSAVENIFWSKKSDLESGTYDFYINNYSHRSGTNGFEAELEINGEIHRFNYNRELRSDEDVKVATLTFDATTGEYSIKAHLDSDTISKEIWGVNTQRFVPVSLVTLSPNYWGSERGVGNKHYMFMLENATNDSQPNGFFNEFIRPELREHKRVFEALGSKLRVPESDEQLSGLGFASTQPNELIVKAIGATERVLKIKF